MESILEILKYTIPGLIVFASTYYILRQYLNNQYQLKALELKSNYSLEAIPLKLQAYERLLLFCERISIPNLIMRLKTRDMTVIELKNSMVISIQKEYEHNMAQQLYASHKLWDIITLAKNDIISFVSDQASSLSSDDNADALASKLLSSLNQLNTQPQDIAINAIKEEAKIILNV